MSEKKEITVQVNADLWEDFTKIHHKCLMYRHSTLELSKLVNNLFHMAIEEFIHNFNHPYIIGTAIKEYLSKFKDSSSDK